MNDGTLTLVLMAGLSGSGKSTLARELSDRLKWRHIEKDRLREQLIQLGFDKEKVGGLAYENAFACARNELLISKSSVILDSSALYPTTLKNALELVATIANVQLKIILCVADQKLREERVEDRVQKRQQSQASVSLIDSLNAGDPSTRNEYLLYFKHLPKNKLILDTNQSLEKCVHEAIRYLISSRYD